MAKLKRLKVDRLRGEPSRYQIVGLKEHYVLQQAVDLDGHAYGWTLLDERFDVLDQIRSIGYVKFFSYLDDARSWLDDGRDLAGHERRVQKILKDRGKRR